MVNNFEITILLIGLILGLFLVFGENKNVQGKDKIISQFITYIGVVLIFVCFLCFVFFNFY
jgi:formate-dependent nitrite reductase membrane component NrfD